MQCHLRAQRSSAFNWGVLPCPTCTVISLDIPRIVSQYYLWYLVKDLNSLPFCFAKCDFWFVWHFSREICHKVMSHGPALKCSLYTQTWYLDLLSPAVSKRFNMDILYPLHFYLTSVPTFLECVAAIKKIKLFIFTKYIYVSQWRLWKYLYFCQLNKS